MSLPENSLRNTPVDVSEDFHSIGNEYFIASRAVGFDPETGTGTLAWERYIRSLHHNICQTNIPFEPATGWELPPGEYPRDFVLPFSLSFVSPRTVRLRIEAHPEPRADSVNEESLMLVREPERDLSWAAETTDDGAVLRNACGSVVLVRDPWRIEFRDASRRDRCPRPRARTPERPVHPAERPVWRAHRLDCEGDPVTRGAHSAADARGLIRPREHTTLYT